MKKYAENISKFVIAFILIFCGIAYCSISVHTNKIKIGIIGALTGKKSIYGISHLRGAELAIDEINKAGGIRGIHLELIALDDEGEMGKASSLAVKLITEDNVIALLGSVDSGVTHVLSMIAVKLHVPHITCVATDPSITRAGSPWTFRTLADDELQTKAIANKLLNLGIKHISVIAGSTRYGKIGAHTFIRNCSEIFKQNNNMCLLEGPFYLTLDSIKNEQIVKKAISNKPQALVLWMLSHEADNICDFLIKINFDGIVAGGDGLASNNFYNKTVNSRFSKIIITCPYLQEAQTLHNISFRNLYYSKFLSYPDSFASHAYDTINLIAHCLNNIPNINHLSISEAREALRFALSNVSNFYGVNGKIEFDKTNNFVQKVNIVEIVNGKPIFIE